MIGIIKFGISILLGLKMVRLQGRWFICAYCKYFILPFSDKINACKIHLVRFYSFCPCSISEFFGYTVHSRVKILYCKLLY